MCSYHNNNACNLCTLGLYHAIHHYLFSLIFQFLDAIRNFDGYCSIRFPHCMCDARKDGPVLLTVSLTNVKLKACTDDGTPLVSEVSKFIYVEVFIKPKLR